MPISIATRFVACLLIASSAVSAQSKAPASDPISGATGVFVGPLRVVGETNRIFGGWLDIRFKGWELATLALEVSRSIENKRRGEWCPYDDCSPRYERDAQGDVKRINPEKRPAPGTRFIRNGTLSVAALRPFKASRHAVPHFVVGMEKLSRRMTYAFDDPTLETRTWRRNAWGPVCGLGVDFLSGRFLARVQYRVDPIFIGYECILICNDQFRVGAGWRF